MSVWYLDIPFSRGHGIFLAVNAITSLVASPNPRSISLPHQVTGLTADGFVDIVHGDVKCENVLVFEKDDARQGETSGTAVLHFVCQRPH